MQAWRTIFMMGLLWGALPACLAGPAPAAGQKPLSSPGLPAQLPSLSVILDRAQQAQAASDRALEGYEWRERQATYFLNGHGGIERTERRTYEVSTVAGREFRELLAKNGRPLSPRKRAAERKRLLRRAEAAARHPRQAAKRLARAERQRRLLRESVPRAFHLQLLGTRLTPAGCVYLISARPRRGWRAPTSRLKILQNVEGEIQVSCQTYAVLALQLRVLKTISYGWLIARIQPGATVSLEAAPGPKRPVFPALAVVQASARLFLFKHYRLRSVVHFDQYRPFTVSTSTRLKSPVQP